MATSELIRSFPMLEVDRIEREQKTELYKWFFNMILDGKRPGHFLFMIGDSTDTVHTQQCRHVLKAESDGKKHRISNDHDVDYVIKQLQDPTSGYHLCDTCVIDTLDWKFPNLNIKKK